MYEIWYVSCHDFGHITRCIAQIERKLESEKSYNYLWRKSDKFCKTLFKRVFR